MTRRALTLVACCAAFAVGACGSADGVDTVETASTPVATIGGVGSLPDTVPRSRQPLVRIPTLVESDGSVATLIGERVDGTRVLLIGDSIFAGASSRYGNEFCEQLTPLGWDVAVEAEPSRFVDFGTRVLDRVLPEDVTSPASGGDDWDAAVVLLGSNYRGDPVSYESELRDILDRLAPRPTVLLTVSEYRDEWSEVNEVVRRLDAEHDDVVLVDWNSISEAPGVLSGDRLHPTNAGRLVLAEVVAAALGPVSLELGECLRSQFRDDSAGVNGGSSSSSSGSSSRGSSSSGRSSGGSSWSGGSSSGGSSGSSSSGGGTVGTTAPPATAAPGGGDGGGSDGDDGTDGGSTDGGGGGGGGDGGSSGDGDGGSSGGGGTVTPPAPPATPAPPAPDNGGGGGTGTADDGASADGP